MRKLIYLTIIVGILTLGSTAIAGDRSKIWDQCYMKFTGNSKMVGVCFNQQIRSYNRVKRYVNKHLSNVDPSNLNGISREARIVINCSNRWKDITFDTYKWDLIDYCIRGSL